jgi:hypothetical protein
MSDDEVTIMTAPVQPGWYPDRSDALALQHSLEDR